MLMNRPIKRGCMEVYNDYNSNLTNLFFCVKERPLALITELGFLPLNSRDDYDAISRQLKCEEFDDEYLAIELELADKYFSPLHAKAIKALLSNVPSAGTSGARQTTTSLSDTASAARASHSAESPAIYETSSQIYGDAPADLKTWS